MDEQFKTSTLNTIREYEQDLTDTTGKLKTLKEMIQEELESMPEFDEVEQAKAALDEAKAKLKQALLGNADYNNMLEEAGQLKEQIRDQKEIISDHVVAYFANTKDRQIEVGTNGEARELIVRGKLGKAVPYQPSLLTDAHASGA